VARQSSGLLDLPAHAGAIRIARLYLDRAGQAIRRLEKRGDAEALHDFRVSLRRLHSNLLAYSPYVATAVSPKQLRKMGKLASATSGGRDAEVHLAWLESRQLDLRIEEAPGIELLREELERRLREGYEEAVARAPRKFRKLDRKLRGRLEALETAAAAGGLDDGVRFETAIERCLSDYAEQLDAQFAEVHTAADEAEAHRARIRAKRLRYILEPIAGDIENVDGLLGRLKELQDLLGHLRDAQLLAGLVAELETRAAVPPATVLDASDFAIGAGVPAAGLRRVAEWLKAEKTALFEQLRDGWLGDRSAAFFGAVGEVRQSLISTVTANVEIERKYLLSAMPPAIEGRPFREIEQGYLPGDRLQERIRRVRADGDEWYVRTVKVGAGIRRMELQEGTDRATFDAMWPLTRGRRVVKRRYRVPEGDLVWEVDEFSGRDLVLAEVELPSEDVRPRLPDWIAPWVVREVTGDPEYLNVNLAR